MNKVSLIVCPNCKNENPYFNLNCSECKYFLRDRIPNINLGEIILSLIESPKSAFEKIIFSENKNYVFVLFILLSIRFFILSRFMSVPFIGKNSDFDLILTLLYFLSTSAVVIFMISYATFFLIKKLKMFVRLKDVISIIIYSFFPSLIALCLLYPIELTVFGNYLFSNNPYPYLIKKNVFYILSGLEIFMIIWSILLNIKGMQSLKLNLGISFMISLLNYSIITLFLYYSRIIFI